VNLAELKDARHAVEKLPAISGRGTHPFLVFTFNDLLARFHRKVAVADQRLGAGHPVETDVAEEIRYLARTLPDLWRRACGPGSPAEGSPGA
jgi:hypothetical protein